MAKQTVALDERVQAPDSVRLFAKRQPSAFTNADLDAYLKANEVRLAAREALAASRGPARLRGARLLLVGA